MVEPGERVRRQLQAPRWRVRRRLGECDQTPEEAALTGVILMDPRAMTAGEHLVKVRFECGEGFALDLADELLRPGPAQEAAEELIDSLSAYYES